MPLTREQKKEAFLHVAENVIRLSSSEIAAFSDSGFDDILLLINMWDDTLSHITILGADKTPEQLSSITRDRIIAFICFYCHLRDSGQFIKDKGWFTLSSYDFDAFCESPHFGPYQGKSLDNMFTVEPWSATEYYKLQFPFDQVDRQAFLHVLDIIDLTSYEIQRLEDFGVVDVPKLQTITESQLSLIFPEPRYQCAKDLVRKFVCFAHHLTGATAQLIPLRELMQLSAKDFKSFCSSRHYDEYYLSKSLDDLHAHDFDIDNISPGAEDKEDHVSVVPFDDDIGAPSTITVPSTITALLSQSEQLVPTISEIESTSCMEHDDVDSIPSCLEEHAVIASVVDLDDPDVNDAGMSTLAAFVEPSLELVRNDVCRCKKSVSIHPSSYPFIPTSLFELRLGSDGDVNENDSPNRITNDMTVVLGTAGDFEEEIVFCQDCYKDKSTVSSFNNSITTSTVHAVSSKIDNKIDIWSHGFCMEFYHALLRFCSSHSDMLVLSDMTLWNTGSYLVIDFGNGNRIIMLNHLWQTLLHYLWLYWIYQQGLVDSRGATLNVRMIMRMITIDVSRFQIRADSTIASPCLTRCCPIFQYACPRCQSALCPYALFPHQSFDAHLK